MNPFKYVARVFSNDPGASCSRILAVLSLVYVMVLGTLYFATLTGEQIQYLLGILSGVLPFAFKKIADIRKPPDGQQ